MPIGQNRPMMRPVYPQQQGYTQNNAQYQQQGIPNQMPNYYPQQGQNPQYQQQGYAPQYQPQYRKQPPQSISDVYSDEEAISQQEKMDDLLSKINGDGAIYNSKDAGTIEQLIAAMNNVAGFMC